MTKEYKNDWGWFPYVVRVAVCVLYVFNSDTTELQCDRKCALDDAYWVAVQKPI